MSETMVKKQLESSEIQTGACRYCGQIYQFETDGRASEDQLDEWATEKCDCGEAEEEKKRQIKRMDAHESIEELIGDMFPGIVGMLETGVDLILAREIRKIQVDIGKGAKVSLSVNDKGNVRVEFVRTAKKSKEV